MDGKAVSVGASRLAEMGIDLKAFTAELLNQYKQEQGDKPAGPPADMRTIRELFNAFERVEIGLNPRVNRPRRNDWRAFLCHKQYLDLPIEVEGTAVPFGDVPWTVLTPSVGNSWMLALEVCPNQNAAVAKAKPRDREGNEKRLSPGYRNRILGTLQSVMKWHVKEKSIGHNPARGWARAENPDGERRGYFPPELLAKFCEDAHPLLRLMIQVSSRAGGMRRNEVRLLRLSEVDFDRKVIRLPGLRTKNRKPREIPMTSDVFAILDAQRRVIPGEFFFPKPRDPEGGPVAENTMGNWMRKAREKSGIILNNDEMPVFHHMRHTGAMEAVEKNVPIPWIMDVFGWESPAMLRRYSKCAGQAMDKYRDLMERDPDEERVDTVGVIRCPICQETYASLRDAADCEDLCKKQTQRRLSPLRRGPRGAVPVVGLRAKRAG
jgi:integrase